MGLLSLFKEIKPLDSRNSHWKVRSSSFFLDDKLHQTYLKNGWVVLRDVLNHDQVTDFKSTLQEIKVLDGFLDDGQFINSGCLHNPEIRTHTQRIIRKHAPQILSQIFDMNITVANTGGTFQIKPCSPNSELQLHQDSAVVDEEKDYCLFVWMPLCDINLDNGPLWALPGSHLWGNTQRSFVTSWNMSKNQKVLKKYLQPILVNAGDVVVFDPALIHYSSPNLTRNVREAVTMTAIREGYQLIYFYRDNSMPKHLIDKYFVDETFFEDYDFKSRPDDSKWEKERIPYEPFIKSDKVILQYIKQYFPKEFL